jgi:hypothetical protein
MSNSDLPNKQTDDILRMALEALEGLILKHRHTHGLDGAWDSELVKGEMAAEVLRQHLK